MKTTERVQASALRMRLTIPTDCWGNPDLGSSKWPKPEDYIEVAHKAIEALEAAEADEKELRQAAERVCRIADTHTMGEVQRGVHDPALNVELVNLWRVLNGD